MVHLSPRAGVEGQECWGTGLNPFRHQVEAIARTTPGGVPRSSDALEQAFVITFVGGVLGPDIITIQVVRVIGHWGSDGR